MLESEANPQMVIDTDKWLLSQEERQQLRRANARLVSEKNQLIKHVNAFKRMVFTALGEMPAEWIDGAVSNLIARNPKKGGGGKKL